MLTHLWKRSVNHATFCRPNSRPSLHSLFIAKSCGHYYSISISDRPINESKRLSVLSTTRTSNNDSTIHNDHSWQDDTNPIQFTECQSIHDILNSLWNSQCVLDDTVYMRAMQKCNDLCDFEGALRIFHLMNKKDITQTTDSYNILIQCLCDCDRTPLAYQYLSEMTTTPNMQTFITILNSCKQRSSYIGIAENVWKKMIFECNLKPNVEVCNAMIHIYARCGEVHKAETVWNHLTRIHKVNSETCAEIINCYAIKKDEKKLVEVQKWMQSNAIPLDETHYLGIIKYYLGMNKLQMVLDTFDEMASSHSISMNEPLLYQLCITYLRLKQPEMINRTLIKQYPKLFNQNHELQGLLFEAHLMRFTDDEDIVPIFKHFIAGNKLTGYWTHHTVNGCSTWWIDVHGVYRRSRMLKFVLRYIFQYEREYILDQLRMKQDIVILCGQGAHSGVHFHGTAKTLTEQELLSWTPPIHSKVYEESKACLVLNNDDIVEFFRANPLPTPKQDKDSEDGPNGFVKF